MMRAATTHARSFGFELFGIDFYRRRSSEIHGAYAVQTPDGVQSVVWSSFEKSSGRFQMDSGSSLTAVSSAATDATNPDTTNNAANLIVQAVVGDKRMDDDILLDSADALIAMLLGPAALEPLDKVGNAMQEAIGRECPILPVFDSGEGAATRDAWDEACNVDHVKDETKKIVAIDGLGLSLVEARDRGVQVFKALPAVQALELAFQELLAKAAELRLTLGMVKVHAIEDDGPHGEDVRHRRDDASLSREICDDERFSRAAKRIQVIYAKADGPGAAADAILELVPKERSAVAAAERSLQIEPAAERAN
jgi:hypothetical protein